MIKKIARMLFFLNLILLFATVVWAGNNNSSTLFSFLQFQQNPTQSQSRIEEIPITDQEEIVLAETSSIPSEKTSDSPLKFKKDDFENSICFRCHKETDIVPSDKTEQQWRMLIEKNGHDIFKKIIWESPAQKEQILVYLIKHAGDSGAEGIGVWH